MVAYSLHLRGLFIIISLAFRSLYLVASDAAASTGKDDDAGREVILNHASERYLAMIFHDYSDSASSRISAERFKDLLFDLNLGEKRPAVSSDEDTKHRHKRRSVRSHKSTRGAEQNHAQSRRRKRRQDEKQRDIDHQGHEDLQHGQKKCLGEDELLRIHEVNKTDGLTEEDFVRICPSLIRQLEIEACVEDEPTESDEHEENMLHVWGYGMLSITVISLTSLLAIAIIPLIGRSIYTDVMSFLVALAVGSLAGDALLHLIPHALLPHESDEEQRRLTVFKSCVILVGIYLFFLVENSVKARLGRRRNKHQNGHKCDGVTPPEKMSLAQRRKYAAEYQEMVGSRLAGIQRCISCDDVHFVKVGGAFSADCKQELKTSCALASVESGKEERASNPSQSSQERELLWNSSCHGHHHCHHHDNLSGRGKHSFSDTELVAVLQGKSCIHPNIYANNNFAASICDSDSQTHHHNVNQIRYHQGNQYSHPTTSETVAETISDGNELEDEGHHHHHHHHSLKITKGTSIASVAWMVIVGDGFHNFSDGLAVGAAFSASLTQGLTTAIAVCCHELPHELGDFAILLKSGLTFKQALAYNMASAIIAYIGLVLGIAIGDIASTHTWILVLTAGMFLYISLVDMLPELSNYAKDGGGWSVVLSQNMGLFAGVGIMLVIALYEKH